MSALLLYSQLRKPRENQLAGLGGRAHDVKGTNACLITLPTSFREGYAAPLQAREGVMWVLGDGSGRFVPNR